MSHQNLKKTFYYLLVIIFIPIFSCGDCNFDMGYGEKLTFGSKQEIYYKDGATEDHARKLGNYFKETGFFDGKSPKSVQIIKSGESFQIRFVIKKDLWKDQKTIKNFMFMGKEISQNVFDKSPVDVHLCDDQLETKKALSWQDIQNTTGNTYYYSPTEEIVYKGVVNEDQAKALASILEEIKYFDKKQHKTVVLLKEKDSYIIQLVLKEESINDTSHDPFFLNLAARASKEIAAGGPVKVQICDTELNPRRTVNP